MTRYTPQWLQAGSYAASQDRRLIAALWPAAASAGCNVYPATAMTVSIDPGQVAVPSANNTGATLCTSDAVEQVTLAAAPPSGTNRYDVITCHPRGADLDGGGNNDFIFDVVQGAAAATPTVPAVPAGQVALAQVYLPGGSATIAVTNITDVRPFGLSVAARAALPPPVTSGAATQAFTDANGEVWVARNAVNGGNWRKARDVLRARWTRAAAWNTATTIAQLNFDTANPDPYGLYAGGLFTPPIAGWWRMEVSLSANMAASGQFLQCQIRQSGTALAGNTMFLAGAGWQGVQAAFEGVLAAGAAGLSVWQAASAALTGNLGQDMTRLNIGYLGTG